MYLYAKKCLACLLILLLAGCSSVPVPSGDPADGTDSATDTTAGNLSFITNEPDDMFTDRDYEIGYDETRAVRVTLSGDTVSADSDAVRVNGSTVLLTEEATYIVSGSLTDGMLVVDAADTAKVQIVLDGAHVTNSTSAPLYILNADKVFLTLAPDSDNSLTAGDTFVAIDENNIDAALFSKQDLTLNGTGTLTVTSPAGHGIVSKDDLVITGGTYTVNTASHGLDANDSIRIANASLTIAAGKDGIHAENNDDASLGFVYIAGGTLDITAEGDGISAGAHMQIAGGDFTILTGGGSENGTKQVSDNFGGFMGGRGGGGGRQPGGWGGDPGSIGGGDPFATSGTETDGTSIKGIKSGTDMLITGGTFTIDSADDAVHSNTSLTVHGGDFTIATGDDAFHAEDTLTVTAGTIDVTESYEGLEALHIDVQGGTIRLKSSDDGLNAAGGTDGSGTGGGRDAMFGGGFGGGMGGGFGGMSSSGGSIIISGGDLFINASGDGIDANGSLTISGGHTVVCGPTQGDTATLDYDTSAVITGGTFLGTGASGMAQTFSDSEQGVIAVSVGNQQAGTAITLTDAAGETVLTHTPELSFAVVILSSPDLKKGETYTITVGTASGEFTAN